MDVKIQILETKDERDFYSPEYLETYLVWHEVWSEEYALLGEKTKLYSDKFTRQDYVVSLLVNGKCAALSCMKHVNLSTEMGRQDSWFNGWPEDVLDQLCDMDPNVLVWSALAVNKIYRGQKIAGQSVSKILAAACTRSFIQHSSAKLMLGSTRNNRGVNSLLSLYGAQTLRTITLNSEPTDLIYFHREKLPDFTTEMQKLLSSFWVEKRLVAVPNAA